MYNTIPSLNPYFAARDRRLQSPWPYEPQQARSAKAPLQCQNAVEGAPSAPRFALGEVIYTANTTLRLRTEEVFTGLLRHANGDWGDLAPEDSLANEEAIRQGGRLFSAYGQGNDRFWIITEADRSVTTVLLPDDY